MSLYAQVVDVSKPYLGPAAERFISRQCTAHLKIEPTAIIRGDLANLSKWVRSSGALVMDERKATELAAKISRL